MTTGWLAVLGLVAPAAALAASIASVSPQGEVRQAQQVVVSFSEAVVPLGDLRRPDPMQLDCSGPPAPGQGRWLDERRWAWDFKDALPPGLRCVLKRRADWKPQNGELTGPAEFRFSTGGPAVLRSHPWSGSAVEEDGWFLLQLNGAALDADVRTKVWCEVDGLAERLPVKVEQGPLRQQLIELRRLQAQADRVLVLQCARPLPPDAKLRLVWGAGIGAAAAPEVRTRSDQRLDFRVRKAFSAEFSCERERANAPCLPIRPLVVRFSSPVTRAQALAVRLQPAGGGGAALQPMIPTDEAGDRVSELRFNGPFAERARFSVVLPPELKDESGRTLANAGSFPLAVATGEAPPIAKFAAAPFGVVERSADAALPITLRHVQGDLRPQASGGRVRVLRLQTDADVIRWYREVARFHESQLPARVLGFPREQWTELVTETDERGKPVQRRVDRMVGTREVSLLAKEVGTRSLDLPALQGGDPRPFEVVGLPLPEPGYHVLEVESRRLGQALLDKAAPMYVRTGALVTNLGVHFKQGRESSAVWVTSLDRARPVADAEVALSDCRGQRLWAGRTGADGVARVPRGIVPDAHCSGDESVFVSARKADAAGVVDMAFVWNGWSKGIEPWRFGWPVSSDAQPDWRVHTVFDRTLLRAGETVSMKHFLRRESAAGLALPEAAERPTRLTLVHVGSGERFTQALAWPDGRSAVSTWDIPAAAKLGLYQVELDNPEAPPARRRVRQGGEFRVEAFKVPLVDARLSPPRGASIAPREVVLSAQLQWMAGGAMAGTPLRGSAIVRTRELSMPGWPEYSFASPRRLRDDDADEPPEDDQGRLVADRVALVTDRDGSARFAVQPLPPVTRPGELQAEVSYADPNGEQQTVSTTVPLWPAAVVLGVRAPSSGTAGQAFRFTVVALDLQGKPMAGQQVAVTGRLARIVSTRKRVVGGFYAYDNRTERRDLGALCSGRTDERGLLVCTAAPDAGGPVELVARAQDEAGRATEAAASTWLARPGEGWFEQDNDDRIDVLPDKRRYEGGETAKLQVRMPFRDATAWVTVEREGVIDTRVTTLRGDDPQVELKIDPAWGPNVYVGVLVLRGRIRHVPWTSFFDWGWKSPFEWARAWWVEGREYQPPTAMVDLAKPAFKLGVTQLQVGLAAHELQVAVTPDQSAYRVRGTARVKLKVTQGGKPVPGTEVAFAAVDEALLALKDNDSWQLLQGLMRPRPWGVQTATATSEIIGRRHYGRKAVAAGGGGGRGPARELFDTLLLWKARVALDANGEALVEVPLNDSLTAFRLVAVADDGAQRFGTGQTTIRVTQDLQLLPGLPALVRDGDRFTARVTLRNTTSREMKLRASLQGTARRGLGAGPEFATLPVALAPQELALPAGASRELQWPVEVPSDVFSIGWDGEVKEQGGGNAVDRVKWTQFVAPAVPLRVLQASLQPLEAPLALPLAPPPDALAAPDGSLRGGLQLALQPTLAGDLAGVQRFFQTYPYTCLEQKTSRAIGLGDAEAWRALSQALPTYLDRDGLAAYFPPSEGDAARGSDRLTAYVLAAAHEAGWEIPAAARDRMLAGLTAFVDGRIERSGWSPQPDLAVRKLAAIEALARHGRAQARQLGSVAITPQQWPTSALIDWVQILRRLDDVPERARRLDEAQALLRARLTWSGSTLRFSTEDSDRWWWLMEGPDLNAARLVLAMVDDPAWRDEMPRLVIGALQRQQGGAWRTTTANLWGVLALRRFAKAFEAAPVAGRTQAAVGATMRTHDWAAAPRGGALMLPWPAPQAADRLLKVQHEGSGKPWLTVQALAAVPLKAPLSAGYTVSRSVVPVERKDAGQWSRGDVLRVRLEVQALADMTWVVVADPLPGGAAVLGSGLGRDSAIATRGESAEGRVAPAYVERAPEAWRAYFERLPRGRHVLEYTMRLSHSGRFALPPTRVEAMYAPEAFGESPNAALEVAP
ncbi:MAG: MG2 domain-containing protein [Rubrivivax sp.]